MCPKDFPGKCKMPRPPPITRRPGVTLLLCVALLRTGEPGCSSDHPRQQTLQRPFPQPPISLARATRRSRAVRSGGRWHAPLAAENVKRFSLPETEGALRRAAVKTWNEEIIATSPASGRSRTRRSNFFKKMVSCLLWSIRALFVRIWPGSWVVVFLEVVLGFLFFCGHED